MDGKEASSEFSKKETQMGVAGLVVGLCLVLGHAYVYSQRGADSSSEPTVSTPEESESEKCTAPGQRRVNNGSVCRPKERIDFYLIEDYSMSTSTQLFHPITSAIQSEFFLEDIDRIACLGFAGSLFPPNQTPSLRSKDGCRHKKQEIDRNRTANSLPFKTTRFGRLFEGIAARLKEERISGEPSYVQEEIHHDLVVILTDGLHDLSPQTLDCSEQGVAPLPEEVKTSFRLLQDDLSEYRDEVWLFLVLINEQSDCLADLERQWQGLRGEGLNIITFDSIVDDPLAVPEKIFRLVDDFRIRARPQAAKLPSSQRKTLDAQGTFEVRYRIDEIGGQGVAPIRNTKIRVEKAWLAPTELCTDCKVIPLAPSHYENDFDLVEGTWIDVTKDHVVLKFVVAPTEQRPGPYEKYVLHLGLDGIAEAGAVEVLPRWQSLLHKRITKWKDGTLYLLLAVLAILGLQKFLRDLFGASEEHSEQQPTTSSNDAPRLIVCFCCLGLLVLALASLFLEPRISFDDRSFTTGLSLLAVFFLQARHHLITECLLALLASIKSFGAGLS